MDLVARLLRRPVSVAVGVLLLVLFGLIGLGAIPVQLVPNVDRPIVTVRTPWPGRTPQEVVEDVTKEQEQQLKNVSNLKRMRSISREDGAEIELEFFLGADISRALQEVSDALRRIPELPPDADEPTIEAAEGANENAIAWIIFDVPEEEAAAHPGFDISTIQDGLDDEVRPFLERIDGVAEVNIFGGREREMRVLVDPIALADRGITPGQLVDSLRAENRDVSAGTIAEGKRDWRVRVTGQFVDPEQVLSTVVTWRDAGPVLVRDVAQVEFGHAKERGFVRSLGHRCVAMNVIRQSGANVLDIMRELKERLRTVESELLPLLTPEEGPRLRLRQVYDETTYLESAIRLVTQNLWIGGSIACAVLIFFLRSGRATAIVALSIPVSVLGTFLALLALGRTLNVISLAGLAFAVGMVVDNAIVVLENIFRRLQHGDSAFEAARRGTAEVWGAILASTLTTVAVFVPVLTIREEAGQLFRDISLAVVAAVTLSLIVSVTVIPVACSKWLHAAPSRASGVRAVAERVAGMVAAVLRGPAWGRPALVLGLTLASVLGAALLAPPLDYLPPGNRNLVFGGLLIPPGYSVQQRESIARRIEADLRPYVEARGDDPESLRALAPIPRPEAPGATFDPVGIENFFIGSFQGAMFVGATSQDEEVVLPVGSLLTNAMNAVPDAFGGARQRSIFGRGAAGGDSIEMEVSGPDLDRVTAAAEHLLTLAGRRYGFRNVRPDPANFNLKQPEWRLVLDQDARELGLTTRELGLAVRSLVDGVLVDEVPHDGRNIDLVVLPATGRITRREELLPVPLATPSGRRIPLDSAARVVPGLAPQEIRRIEELPSVILGITPPEGRALEDVMREIREEFIAPTEASGLIDPTMRVRLEGTAAKLDEVKASLLGQDRPARLDSPWQLALAGVGVAILIAGLAAGVRCGRRAADRRQLVAAVGGTLLLGALAGGLVLLVAVQPQLLTARFAWALLVTYLVIAALFESFLHPLVIMFSVPLAVVGGFAGLAIVHAWTLGVPERPPQQLDVLTILGFVILVGVVVNNAILLVHRALQLMRGEGGGPGLGRSEAIAGAVRDRLRPIFMSALTSVGGMMPLVLFPGSGSEMYRGLGSVVVGGLLMSTVFTLLLVPVLLSLVLDMASAVRATWGDGPAGAA